MTLKTRNNKITTEVMTNQRNHVGGSQTYTCITVSYLSNGLLALGLHDILHAILTRYAWLSYAKYRAALIGSLSTIVYESASATLLMKQDIMQAKALRLILGAVKTTPIAAIQVESSELPQYLRREQLAMAYLINLQGQREDHPVREVRKESWETVNKQEKDLHGK